MPICITRIIASIAVLKIIYNLCSRSIQIKSPSKHLLNLNFFVLSSCVKPLKHGMYVKKTHLTNYASIMSMGFMGFNLLLFAKHVFAMAYKMI